MQCPYCIDAYTADSLEKGATPEQMTEAVHVAAAIRGGASLVHGVQMRNHVDEALDVGTGEGRAGRPFVSRAVTHALQVASHCACSALVPARPECPRRRS